MRVLKESTQQSLGELIGSDSGITVVSLDTLKTKIKSLQPSNSKEKVRLDTRIIEAEMELVKLQKDSINREWLPQIDFGVQSILNDPGSFMDKTGMNSKVSVTVPLWQGGTRSHRKRQVRSPI